MNEDIMFITEDQVASLNAAQPVEVADTQKYLIFMTDGLKLGVDAEQVVEIITDHNFTYLPMLPHYIRGIINLRGLMVPILDIRLRLGKEAQEGGLVVVLNIEGVQIGILVDSVDQMFDIPKDSILPVPVHSSQDLVSGMCSLPDGSGTMMLLECAQLLHE